MSSFFHTLVVVGAGLSLANCGGESRGDDHAGGGGDAGASGGATGGTSTGGSGGTGSGTGGTISIGGASYGGAVSSGGTDTIFVGGGAPWGGMGGLPSTQWSCETQAVGCGPAIIGGQSVSALELDEPCIIDPNRPVTPADCAAGERFRCKLATLEAQTLLVDCACSVSDPSCNCRDVTAVCIGDANEPCAEAVILCGCAVTCIAI